MARVTPGDAKLLEGGTHDGRRDRRIADAIELLISDHREPEQLFKMMVGMLGPSRAVVLTDLHTGRERHAQHGG